MKRTLLLLSSLFTLSACAESAPPQADANGAAAGATMVKAAANAAAGTVQAERMGQVMTLPESWPAHWIIAQDGSFFHMSDGKFIVLDADSDNGATRYKGMFNGSAIAQFVQARSRPEMYVAETFHSRGHRGERTDVLTIYDKRNLSPVGEVVIPPKRASEMPTQYNVQLTGDEQLALIYNFTPATSVSVVDIGQRTFQGEVATSGCALVYPTGKRSFSSLCADGTMLTVGLDANGKQASSQRSKVFFDVDTDAMMERAAIHKGVAYFPTFKGNVIPVDLNGDKPVIGASWSLVGDDAGGWRPGGLQLAGTDAAGKLYVLMHPDGGEGTHKNPGTEVWVFDPVAGQRVARLALQTPAISIALTRDDKPLMVATNINLTVDVYAAGSGAYQRTLADFGQETPFILHGAL